MKCISMIAKDAGLGARKGFRGSRLPVRGLRETALTLESSPRRSSRENFAVHPREYSAEYRLLHMHIAYQIVNPGTKEIKDAKPFKE